MCFEGAILKYWSVLNDCSNLSEKLFNQYCDMMLLHFCCNLAVKLCIGNNPFGITLEPVWVSSAFHPAPSKVAIWFFAFPCFLTFMNMNAFFGSLSVSPFRNEIYIDKTPEDQWLYGGFRCSTRDVCFEVSHVFYFDMDLFHRMAAFRSVKMYWERQTDRRSLLNT